MDSPAKPPKLPRHHKVKGPVLKYLEALGSVDDKNVRQLAKDTILTVQALLKTPGGATLLELLDKSVVELTLDPLSEPRALEAHNAQRLIAHDLWRIMSNDTDRVLEQKTPVES